MSPPVHTQARRAAQHGQRARKWTPKVQQTSPEQADDARHCEELKPWAPTLFARHWAPAASGSGSKCKPASHWPGQEDTRPQLPPSSKKHKPQPHHAEDSTAMLRKKALQLFFTAWAAEAVEQGACIEDISPQLPAPREHIGQPVNSEDDFAMFQRKRLQLFFIAWAAEAVERNACDEEQSPPSKNEEDEDDDVYWDSDQSSTATTLAQESFISEITADESVLGPDGDIYEVFYPDATPPRTPAEDCIGSVLASLHEECAALQPFKSWLFEVVRTAASEALGEAFERMVLVGSAALQIDVPTSDIDAVAFTNGRCDDIGALHEIAAVLQRKESTLQPQVIARARVPVLVVSTPHRQTSMDLTIDQSLPERHARWFQSHEFKAADCQTVPRPFAMEELSLQASFLRCVKWWLWQRQVPGMKEGGYPVLAWMLMALHSLQCSLVVQEGSADSRNNHILRALAAFFDRFAGEGRRSGTILFLRSGLSEFQPSSATAEASGLPALWPSFSVRDPVADDSSQSQGDLVPKLSMATQLLYAAEVRRAQLLSAAALNFAEGDSGARALACLFARRPESAGALPVSLSSSSLPKESARGNGKEMAAIKKDLKELDAEPGVYSMTLPPQVAKSLSVREKLTLDMHWAQLTAAFVFKDGHLELAVLRSISPRRGWTAPFLHRRDAESTLWAQTYSIDEQTGAVAARGRTAELCFTPADFVALAVLETTPCLRLNPDDLMRWRDMRELLAAVRRSPSAAQVEQKVEHAAGQPTVARGRRRKSSGPHAPGRIH